jgi:hypothetical protein
LVVASIGFVLGLVMWFFYLAPSADKARAETEEVRTLKERGVTTQGRVTRVWREQETGLAWSGVKAEYEFTADGFPYEGTMSVLPQNEIRMGDAVTITYLPEAPYHHRVGEVDAKTLQDAVQEQDRTVKQNEEVLLAVGIVVAAVAAVTGLPAFVACWSVARNHLRLAQYGVPATAVVTSLSRAGIRYTFTTPRSEKVTGAKVVTKLDGRPLEVGSHLTVLYDPNQPDRHQLYHWLASDIEFL